MTTLNKEHIDMIETPAGGFKRVCLELLGVSWPPKQGWRKRLEGTEIDDFSLALAIQLSETGKQPPSLAKQERQYALSGQRDLL